MYIKQKKTILAIACAPNIAAETWPTFLLTSLAQSCLARESNPSPSQCRADAQRVKVMP